MYYITPGICLSGEGLSLNAWPFFFRTIHASTGERDDMAFLRLVMAFILASMDIGGQLWLTAHGHNLPNSVDIVALIAVFLATGKSKAK
jgi:hypothetical protein